MPELKPPKTKDLESEKPPFTVYCNAVEIGYSPWDIRITLKEMIGAEGDVITYVKHGSVVMSPTHAKATLAALQSAIKTYEEKFGEIELAKLTEAINALQEQAQQVKQSPDK